MKLNRKWLLVIALVVSMATAISGTLAYLTDRESATNVFTMDNVEIQLNEAFEQNATLLPGKYITKKPTITNTGDQNAWVWLEFAIPAALDVVTQGSDEGSADNIIHWNTTGATIEGYWNREDYDTFYNAAINDGRLDKNVTKNMIKEGMNWNVYNSLDTGVNSYVKNINGVDYNVYVLLYNKALEPNETTLVSIHNVFMDSRVDIDTDGQLYLVDGGKVTKVEWNINTDGSPVIYVNAYGIQEEGFETVSDAYAKYNTQWGDNGTEYLPAARVTKLTNSAVITKTVNKAERTILAKNKTITTTSEFASKGAIGFDAIPLDVAYQFEPIETKDAGAASKYANWHADFFVYSDKDVPPYGVGLAGYYKWCDSLVDSEWVMIGSPITFVAGEKNGTRLVAAMGATVSYAELCDWGNDGIGFLCGAVNLEGKTINNTTSEGAASGTTMTVELRLYEVEPDSTSPGRLDAETGNYITIGTYTYTF